MEFAIVRTPFFCFSAFSCEHECDECEKNNNKIVEIPDIYHESAIIEEIHQQYKNIKTESVNFQTPFFHHFPLFLHSYLFCQTSAPKEPDRLKSARSPQD